MDLLPEPTDPLFMEERQGSIMMIHRVAIGVLLIGLLLVIAGCGESHSKKKQEMVDNWEKSTANAQLPVVENMIEQGRIAEAKKILAECIQSNPKEPQVHVLIGRIRAIEGHNVQSREAFEKAIKLDEQNDQAWHLLGALAVLEKDYDRALECYSQALDLMPAKADYAISLSEVYAEIDQLEKALEAIDQSLSMDPQNLELLLSKARLYQQDGQIDVAVRTYEQARIMHGDIPEVLEPAGYAHIAQNNWEMAAEKFDLLMKQYAEDDPRYNATMQSSMPVHCSGTTNYRLFTVMMRLSGWIWLKPHWS
jgi:tetratricopeptide (TPR) repeat protein